jgi:OmpA-OmpF porin, OOP family
MLRRSAGDLGHLLHIGNNRPPRHQIRISFNLSINIGIKAMHTNTMKLRLSGLLAPVAIAMTLSAPLAFGTDAVKHYWSAQPEGFAWVNPYGECWQSEEGPTDLQPCAPKLVVPAEISVRLNFKFDKYGLNDIVNDAELARLDEYISQVKQTPEQESIVVVGHTDAKGSDEYNMALGQRRADTMRDYMVSKGLSPDQISTSSEGKRVMLPEYDIYSVEQRRAKIMTSVAQ